MLQKISRIVRQLSRWIIVLGLVLAAAAAFTIWQITTQQPAISARTPVYLPTRSASDGPVKTVNVYVSEEGAYEVTSADLQAAGFSARAEALALTWRGQPVPLEIIRDDAGFRLRFYGAPTDSRYSSENVYQFHTGTPLTMTLTAPPTAAVSASAVYTATIRQQENKVYAPQTNGTETWFWQAIPAKSSLSAELNLTDTAPGDAYLRLGIWSDTQADISPDHHLQASINGSRVLDAEWEGKGVQVLEAKIPAGVLASGANTIEISVPGDLGITAERSYLDWIEIQYPRPANAQADFLALPGSGQPIQISGFSQAAVTIWQVNGITSTQRIETENAVIPGELGRRYLVIGPQGFRTPRLQAATNPPDLRAIAPAPYLAFGPADLLEAAQPLLDWRSQHGLSAAAIPLQAVYDQFGAGFPEPQAIQRFLAYAAANWPEAPQIALLVGDFTFDPRGYTVSPEANRLPTFFVQTQFGGETASDVPFADLDGDGLPDLAIGRLPARTPAEVQTYVQKVLAYEGQTDTAWRKRLFTIADGQEASFASDAQVFAGQFTNDLFEKTAFAPPAGVEDGNTQIAASLAEGFGLVGYFGHGSIAMWGKDRLFTTEDVANLQNADFLPVVINMNCLTGLFTHPKTASLAETFLWQENGGAIAVLAPTSLTLPTDQAMLSGALARQFSSNLGQTLGASFLAAQRQMPANPSGANEVLLTFLFFGDPALRPWAVTQK